MSEANQASAPSLQWDLGTAYEFLISLHVLHMPDQYDVRASWAAGMRERIPAAERKFLEEVLPFLGIPLCWIYTLPKPKDAISVLWALRQIPPERRASTLICLDQWDKNEAEVLARIAEAGAWSEADLELLPMFQHKKKAGSDHTLLKHYLDRWARPAEFGEMLLSALQAYYEAFFEQEEKRVAPVLQAGLERAQELAGKMDIPELITELSQGVHLEDLKFSKMILAPAFWTTPLVVFEQLDEERMLFLFGARPADMPAIPGEMVPDALVHTLKALADPTRLKIMYYINQKAYTPSELARKLQLRAPTVTHHLNELRLSGLVHMSLKGQEKFYTARLEALDDTCGHLKEFLQKPSS
jgi:DNA-binding transcriptional ArsR family regulator